MSQRRREALARSAGRAAFRPVAAEDLALYADNLDALHVVGIRRWPVFFAATSLEGGANDRSWPNAAIRRIAANAISSFESS